MVLLNTVHCELQHAAAINRGEGVFLGQVASKGNLQLCVHICAGGGRTVVLCCACVHVSSLEHSKAEFCKHCIRI